MAEGGGPGHPWGSGVLGSGAEYAYDGGGLIPSGLTAGLGADGDQVVSSTGPVVSCKRYF